MGITLQKHAFLKRVSRCLAGGHVVRRAEISFSHKDFRRVVRGVRGEVLKQQHPSPAEPIMNLWFRLRRAGNDAATLHA